ncbi:hypothetical protein ACFQX8_18140 [Klenkia terrae]|uniref:hypothetical protein n=1 Tax=Klenkia terrae TaxID=1052259 RepID=UPI00360DFEDD
MHGDELPWRDLRDGMLGRGWADVTNGTAVVEVDGRRIAVRGVDDPHLQRDDYDAVAGPTDAGADLRLGLVHSPSPGCSTASPPTGTTWCCPATPTAASCGCRSTARW